jgi:hypothetical protein
MIKGGAMVRTATTPRSGLRWHLAAALGMLLGGCDTLGPIHHVNPELADAQAFIWPRASGVIEILATPANSSFRLPRRGRVEILIESSGGDAESVQLYRLYCPPHREMWVYQCNSLTIMTLPGVAVTDVESRVVALGGRFTFVSALTGSWAVALFPAPHTMMAARQRVLEWPEVLDAFLDGPGCAVCDDDWLNGIQAALSAAIALDVGSPIVGDGTVQFSPGDTLTLRYANPGGGELVRFYVIPPPL